MGLIQDDSSHQPALSLRTWLLPGAVVAVTALLALGGDPARDWLSYDRAAIADGQLWRLLSGHLVHMGWSHFALNAIGLLLICQLVADRFTSRHWLGISVATIVGIDIGFWLLEPQLEWYVGLSGLLHGLLAAGVVGGLRDRHREAWVLGALLVAKLAYEQLVGPIPGSAESTGGAVITAAHLYGAVAGIVVGAVIPVRVRAAASI